VIDPQTHIAAKGSGAIIPPGKLSTLFMMEPEGIRKSPSLYFVERCTLSLAAHDSLLPKLRVVNVAILRGNIEVSAKDNRRARLVVVIEKTAQPSHPVKFKLKLLRTNRLSIRYVNVDEANLIKRRREQARVRSFLIFVIASLNSYAFLPRYNRYAVIALLSKHARAVTNSRKLRKRKLVVGTLRFLHAKDIGLDCLEPTDYMRQAGDYRVNVPGGNFHWVLVLGSEQFSKAGYRAESLSSPGLFFFEYSVSAYCPNPGNGFP
jgi:hypothetical protein